MFNKSNVCEFSFQYDVIKKNFPEAQLLFTDTDSLYYYVEREDFEADLYKLKEYFDYSGYKEVDGKPHPYFNNDHKLEVGKFKCETGGVPIVEFVGLRPKMYSYIFKDYSDPNAMTIEKNKIKGIARSAARDLRHQMYLDQVTSPKENYIMNKRIGSKLHELYSYSVV